MKFLKYLLMMCSLLATHFTQAEDIDLFVSHDVSKSEKSRVLLLFDTSGSMDWDVNDGKRCYVWRWGSYRSSECFDSTKTSTVCYKWDNGYRRKTCGDSRLKVAKRAMKKLVSENKDFEFGLMRLRSGSGGYVLSGIGAEESELLNKIDALPGSGSTPITETLWEAYLYLTGGEVDWAEGVGGRDKSIESGDNYISPFKQTPGESKRCDNSINIILMTDGDPTNDSGSNQDIKDMHKDVFGTDTTSYKNSYMNSLARLLRGNATQIVDLYPTTSDEKDFARVFTIGFGTENGMSENAKKLLKQTAKDGGGSYAHANTAHELSTKLKETINQIREINDSFSSPSVTISASDKTRHRDGLYYTMFLPKTHTRWKGNLKKLVMENGKVIDMNKDAGLDEKGGVIAQDATTYWSKPGSRDGNQTQEGGVNYQLSKQSSRNIYSDYGKGKLYSFTYTEARRHYSKSELATALGGLESESEAIINWTRGVDVMNTNPAGNKRLDIFGDPLHSKPVTMDFDDKGVRIFIGTNAGVLHAFNDKGNTVEESWAFVPASLFKILKPYKDAQPDTKLYGMDGPMSIFFKDINRDGKVNGSDKVWLFAGMRRGGDKYYAIDITNPDVPKLMWGGPISPARAGFAELGQTWSKPMVTYIRQQKDKPVLIFAAGYDTNKDNVLRTSDGKGRGLYIVDAESGRLIWSITRRESGARKFKGGHSIAADLTLLDTDYDGFTDRLYAADTAGNIWRLDMPKDSPTDVNHPWTHFKFARFGSSTSLYDRRFFYKPLVARTYFSKVTQESVNGQSVFKRRDTPYDAVIIGTGNRSNPLGKYVDDHLLMLRDENTITRSFEGDDIPAPITMSDLQLVNNEAIYNALNDKVKFQKEEAKLSAKKGWRYRLKDGEKSLSSATVLGGVVYFTTFQPAGATTENQCSLSGGSGAIYAFHMHLGARIGKNLKTKTTRDLPDTPTVFFNPSATMLKTGVPEKPLKTTNKPVVGKLAEDSQLGITTRQMYIYKREEHDEK